MNYLCIVRSTSVRLGITIQSAAVSSFYKGNRINLIDTPGSSISPFFLSLRFCRTRGLHSRSGASAASAGRRGHRPGRIGGRSSANAHRLAPSHKVPPAGRLLREQNGQIQRGFLPFDPLNRTQASHARFVNSTSFFCISLHSVVPIVLPIRKDGSKSAVGFLNLLTGSCLMVDDTAGRWRDVEVSSRGFSSIFRTDRWLKRSSLYRKHSAPISIASLPLVNRKICSFQPKSENADLLAAGREEFFAKVAEHDDQFANVFLQCANYADLNVQEAIPGPFLPLSFFISFV